MKAQWCFCALLSALLLYGPVAIAVAAPTPQQVTVVNTLSSVRHCDAFDGANAGAKIAACIADLPSTGGVADARGLEGAQTISSTITISKPLTLLLGNAVFTCSVGAANCITATEQRDIIIRGAGANETTVAGSTTTTGTKFIWAGSGATALMKFNGVENIEVSDLSLDGNSVASGIGIELLNGTIDTSSVLFKRVAISHFTSKGIKLSASGANSVDVSMIDDATFRSNGTGLTFEAAQVAGWSLRQLRFINNTTGLETVAGGGFHCLNCSWSSTVNPSTAAKLTSVSDNITFENNAFEMGTGGTALTSSASGCSGLRCIVRVVGSRLDKSGTLGQDLITWNSQINLYMEANRIKDGVIRLNNVIDDSGNEAIHTFIGNWFGGTVAQADLILGLTASSARSYLVFEYNNQQSTDILNAIRRPLVRYRRVQTSVIDTWEFGPRLIHNTIIGFANGDTTPSVAGGSFFGTSNSSGTTITAFDDGVRGQRIVIRFNDANTTLSDSGTLRLAGAFTSTADDIMELIFDGTDWFEISRSVN